MAIANKLTSLFPGFGQVTEYIVATAVNLPINATTTTALTGFANYIRNGRIRFKLSAAPAACQITAIKITGTDGSLTVTLYQDAVARTAAELVDLLFHFISELNLTTISVAVTMANAGTAATADFEVAGNN